MNFEFISLNNYHKFFNLNFSSIGHRESSFLRSTIFLVLPEDFSEVTSQAISELGLSHQNCPAMSSQSESITARPKQWEITNFIYFLILNNFLKIIIYFF